MVCWIYGYYDTDHYKQITMSHLEVYNCRWFGDGPKQIFAFLLHYSKLCRLHEDKHWKENPKARLALLLKCMKESPGDIFKHVWLRWDDLEPDAAEKQDDKYLFKQCMKVVDKHYKDINRKVHDRPRKTVGFIHGSRVQQPHGSMSRALCLGSNMEDP